MHADGDTVRQHLDHGGSMCGHAQLRAAVAASGVPAAIAVHEARAGDINVS